MMSLAMGIDATITERMVRYAFHCDGQIALLFMKEGFAAGGMGLSLIGMASASLGLLSPIQGAIAQEAIDLLSILNSLRMILPPGSLTDFDPGARLPDGKAGRSVLACDGRHIFTAMEGLLSDIRNHAI